jgi:hypothetical protein
MWRTQQRVFFKFNVLGWRSLSLDASCGYYRLFRGEGRYEARLMGLSV